MRETGQKFVTLYGGHIVEIPLLQHESGEVMPEDYGVNVEITRRWCDYKYAAQLRQEGVPVVSASLLMCDVVR